MEKGKQKNDKRTARRSKKSNAGLIFIFLIIIAIFAAVTVMNRYANNPTEDSAAIETANTNSTNLPQLAEERYGNPAFWVYIYEANQQQLSSPVNIPAGIPLLIPDLADRNINVDDSMEIAKAKFLTNKIFTERKIVR
ncbi:MAG: hypothetical protein LBG77_05805 [Dysgonamonadaceae bacterium]|jgi:hypothetical protein|nr:hypothetical protein [Dysgonamonadaceae bacterium]